MNAERIKSIIKSNIMVDDKSSLDGCCLFDKRVLLMAIRDAAYEITAEPEDEAAKSEPPEPPKTVLPDMSEADCGTHYWFRTEVGEQPVHYWRTTPWDTACWRLSGTDGWFPADRFIEQHPHLGRLHKTGPKEVAE